MVMVKSAIKKSCRKSQREAARVQKQTDAALAMEEEEEIVFKRPRTIPNTPRASRANTPDPDDREEEPRDFTDGLTDGQDRTRSVDGPGIGQHQHSGCLR